MFLIFLILLLFIHVSRDLLLENEMSIVLPFLTDAKQEQESISHATSKWIRVWLYYFKVLYISISVWCLQRLTWEPTLGAPLLFGNIPCQHQFRLSSSNQAWQWEISEHHGGFNGKFIYKWEISHVWLTEGTRPLFDLVPHSRWWFTTWS